MARTYRLIPNLAQPFVFGANLQPALRGGVASAFIFVFPKMTPGLGQAQPGSGTWPTLDQCWGPLWTDVSWRWPWVEPGRASRRPEWGMSLNQKDLHFAASGQSAQLRCSGQCGVVRQLLLALGHSRSIGHGRPGPRLFRACT